MIICEVWVMRGNKDPECVSRVTLNNARIDEEVCELFVYGRTVVSHKMFSPKLPANKGVSDA